LADPLYRDPLSTAFHEPYHVAERLLQTDRERAVMERSSRDR
jgi:hypothetical protein